MFSFYSKQSTVLFDTGEGTYGQMYRHYGNELDNVLKKIKFILISHMHADHHLVRKNPSTQVQVQLDWKRQTNLFQPISLNKVLW